MLVVAAAFETTVNSQQLQFTFLYLNYNGTSLD